MRLFWSNFRKDFVNWQETPFTDFSKDIFCMKNLIRIVAKVKTVPSNLYLKVFMGLILYFGYQPAIVIALLKPFFAIITDSFDLLNIFFLDRKSFEICVLSSI
jgi:hypothetical protein